VKDTWRGCRIQQAILQLLPQAGFTLNLVAIIFTVDAKTASSTVLALKSPEIFERHHLLFYSRLPSLIHRLKIGRPLPPDV